MLCKQNLTDNITDDQAKLERFSVSIGRIKIFFKQYALQAVSFHIEKRSVIEGEVCHKMETLHKSSGDYGSK